MRIMKIMKNLRIQYENHADHENSLLLLENHANHENPRIPPEN